MNPRLNRLKADYEKMRELDERSSKVYIMEKQGDPPTKYALLLTCRGISKVDENGKPEYIDSHQLGIYLPEGYPGKRPILTMLTPVWHPNIAQNGSVCYGDDGDHGWAPSMGLDDLVIRVMNMIRYENMGLDSAFNTYAAAWANKNRRLFPLETTQIIEEPLLEIDILGEINIIDDDLMNQIKIN